MGYHPHERPPVLYPETYERMLPQPLNVWNQTATDYPRETSVAQLFEQTATNYPDKIALVFGCKQLTYTELNTRANRLAHRLRRMGVKPETLVGCCIERSLDLIVALLAILKTGAAYVPLEPSYPKERLDFLIEDTRTPVMLTQRSLATTVLAGHSLPFVFVDDDAAASASEAINSALAGEPTSLAYVMYTSGSSGRPKGVLVENRAIVRLVRSTNFCHFGPEEVFLQFAPISFDASTFEIWGPLLNGGRLVLMPPHASSLEALGRTIRTEGVTTLWLTAGLFHLMVEERIEDLRPIRQLLAGGDVLSPRHVRLLLESLPDCCLINGYGPTENTTFTCCYPMRSGDPVPEPVPIGRPISNTQVYILDDQLRPVLPGTTGELFAAGDGLARGYLNNPETTVEKFLPNPFVANSNERMYRTGDLARWREDGTIEFLGRIDSQLKILGYRIEPGEIETVLQKHDGVKQVCVTSQDENGSKRLVAYYVRFGNSGVSPHELRAFLAERLPRYMIPSLFVPLPSLPLSPNGKVDRSGLPSPSAHANGEGVAKTPSTNFEQVILELWRQVLGTEGVGLDDNFFDRGGDSLLIVAVHSNLEKILQVEIPVTDLFEFTTIRTLARHLSTQAPAKLTFCEVKERAQKQRDAFAQARSRRKDTSS
jgi:amino acid adenylation domain-containing protein